jgi:hypothetical protein
MGEALFIIVIIVVIIVIALVISFANSSERTGRLQAGLGRLRGFQATQVLFTVDGQLGLAADDSAKKLCIMQHATPEPIYNVFAAKDLLSSEVVQDGVSVTTTSRAGQVKGAIVGSVIAGGVGAIVGGLSAKTTTSQEVQRVELRITVNDAANPIRTFPFLTFTSKLDDYVYKQAIEQARHWHGVISVFIKHAEREQPSATNRALGTTVAPAGIPTAAASVADEIEKLAVLLDRGLLTQDEFQQQKAKLLNA